MIALVNHHSRTLFNQYLIIKYFIIKPTIPVLPLLRQNLVRDQLYQLSVTVKYLLNSDKEKFIHVKRP